MYRSFISGIVASALGLASVVPAPVTPYAGRSLLSPTFNSLK